MFTSRKGFTLIELMIVVSIIGVLAAIAIPKFGVLIAKAHDANTLGQLAVLRSTLSIYYSNNEGIYPQGPSDMPYSGPCPYLTNSLVPEYMSKIPDATPSIGFHPASGEVKCYWNNDGTDDSNIDHDKGKGWKYIFNHADKNFGAIFPACAHLDSRGRIWTTY